LLLHGGGIDSAWLSWGASIVPLSKSHRVFAPDLPGYGESDQPDVQYTLDYYVQFVASLLQALGLEKVSLIGLSLGGGIALRFALDYPARVDKLVPVDPYGILGEYPAHKLSYLYVHSPFNALSYRLVGLSRGMVRQSLLSGAFHDPQRLAPELVEDVYRAGKAPGAGNACASFQRYELLWNGVSTDLRSRLHEIAAPTLFVNGSEDRLVTATAAREAQRLTPNAKLYILEGCAHWSQREKPDEFNRVVLDFLDG
jgi:pimeloyl-ACP methyl ester carboxylesterase